MKAGQHLFFNSVCRRGTHLGGYVINALVGPFFSPVASDPETLVLPSGMNLGTFQEALALHFYNAAGVSFCSVIFHAMSNMTDRSCFETQIFWFSGLFSLIWTLLNCLLIVFLKSVHFLGFVSSSFSFPLVLATFSNVMRCCYFKFLLLPTGLLPDENWAVFSLRARPDRNQVGSLVCILCKFIIFFFLSLR